MIIIDKYSHNFCVRDLLPVYLSYVTEFCKQLIHITFTRRPDGSMERQLNSIFAFRTDDKREFRFHINHLQTFLRFLESKGLTQYELREHHPVCEPATVEFHMNPNYQLMDYQIPIFNYLVEPGYKKVVELQPGKGKTVIALAASNAIKKRVMLVIKPMYFNRWLETLYGDKHILNLNPNKDVMIVSGSSQLAGLIDLALNDQLRAKFIIMSNVTLSNFYNDYKMVGFNDRYGNIHPNDLYQVLGVGIKMVDESHQDFHRCFVSDLFTHVEKSIELSATLVPDDNFLNEMYKILYPKNLRITTGEYDRYTEILNVTYKFSPYEKPIRATMRGRSDYSQIAYEQGLLKAGKRFKQFLKLLVDTIQRYYLTPRYEASRLLILADTVAMCIAVRDHLRTLYPAMVISKYTSEDDYTVFDTSDIVVSTTKSAGTAIDISNLQTVISITNRGSKQAVEQMIGRLRKPKKDEFTPCYVVLVNMDIPAHVRYYHKNHDDLKLKVLRYHTVNSGCVI